MCVEMFAVYSLQFAVSLLVVIQSFAGLIISIVSITRNRKPKTANCKLLRYLPFLTPALAKADIDDKENADINCKSDLCRTVGFGARAFYSAFGFYGDSDANEPAEQFCMPAE